MLTTRHDLRRGPGSCTTQDAYPHQRRSCRGKGHWGVIVLGAILAVSVRACHEVFHEDRQAKEIARQFVADGGVEELVRLLRRLPQHSAYSTGSVDGVAAYNKFVTGHQRSPTAKEKRLFAQAKHEVFEHIRSHTRDYGVSETILSEYRRGWMDAFTR